jgi:DNA-binding PucR family transcriptional regulator
VNVQPIEGDEIFAGSPGAFANVLAFAQDSEDFRRRAEDFFLDRQLRAVEFEDVEPLEERLETHDVPQPILELASKVERERSVEYDTFFGYDDDTDDD